MATALPFQGVVREPRSAAPARTLVARFVGYVHDLRIRQAEQEVATMISTAGGRLTDDLERRIERRFA